MDPITWSSIGLGVLNAGLGVFGGYQEDLAQRQNYLNQQVFQDANNRFSIWQAGFNARVQDANNQRQFWQQTFNYNQDQAYANSQRNVELLQRAEQAKVVFDNRVAAGVSYMRDSQAVQDALAEAEMSSAVAQQQYVWRALQARASVQAMGMEGNSVDRIVNDYSRQLGDQMALESINSDIRERQYTREQAGLVSSYLSRWNSQAFYNPATVFDPIMPFAPLPTMIAPPPPTMSGGGPSNAAFAANVGSSLLGGVSAGLGLYQNLNSLRSPSAARGPGTRNYRRS